MIETSLAIMIVSAVVTIGVTLTGIMFHWLRGDISGLRSDITTHLIEHTKGKSS